MSMTITYKIGKSLYLNITNQCPNKCSFCIRESDQGINPNESLWLEREPSLDEIISALTKEDLRSYEEIVFCGYGEPTMRLDVLLDVAKYLNEQSSPPLRLNTTGLSDLVHNKKTAPLLAKYIERINISLNAPNAETYVKLCKPVHGTAAYEAMLNFAKECKGLFPQVTLSVVAFALNEAELESCRKICAALDIPLRLR